MLFVFAESLGIERSSLFAISGLSLEDLANPDVLVPYECLAAIWKELVARHPTAPLGLRFASTWTIDGLGVVGYALRHARDGHQALALTERLIRLVDPHLRVAIETRGDVHHARFDHEPWVLAMVEPMEMLVLATVQLAISLVRDDVRPTEVCFRHAARHPPAVYAELLGPDVPVRFGASFDGIVFPSALLDLPLKGADPRVAGYLAKHAETLLEALKADDAPLEERVRDAVGAGLVSGEIDAPRIAKTLGVSVRSLQRELHERGTSFSREVDRVRREQAITLLRRPELTVAEIAFMLGYAEARVFHRSFRRWTGTTPADYRRTERAAQRE